jgi:hypothetical protein
MNRPGRPSAFAADNSPSCEGPMKQVHAGDRQETGHRMDI